MVPDQPSSSTGFSCQGSERVVSTPSALEAYCAYWLNQRSAIGFSSTGYILIQQTITMAGRIRASLLTLGIFLTAALKLTFSVWFWVLSPLVSRFTRGGMCFVSSLVFVLIAGHCATDSSKGSTTDSTGMLNSLLFYSVS